MSFLVPLYLAGLAALSLPVLFHLIRRAPRGETRFSTTMFLSPSPPRLTRRSRLDNLILLILRGLALLLLALAFARPFLRTLTESTETTAPVERVAILIDTSASMQRGNLWDDAVDQALEAVGETRPQDELAIYAFDDTYRAVATFDETAEVEPGQRRGEIAARLRAVNPTWRTSQLGQVLGEIATLVSEPREGEQSEVTPAGRIVLVSDMAAGSRVDALREIAWPKSVRLELMAVEPSDPTNAGIERLTDMETTSDGGETSRELRIRVTNALDSSAEAYRLQWVDGMVPLGNAQEVFAPRGESRVVRLAPPPVDAKEPRLVLQGDAHDFDNTVYFVPPRSEPLAVVYLGLDDTGDAQGLRFYFESAVEATGSEVIELVTRTPADESLLVADKRTQLVVVAAQPSEAQLAELEKYLAEGGQALVVLTTAEETEWLGPLLGSESLAVTEADVAGYTMLGKIDLNHPLFAAMASPQFSDFTQIRFWKYRQLDAAQLEGARVVAAFEGGDPAIVEQSVGEGTVTLMTSGWHPADSQIARSWKFLLLLASLVEPPDVATQFASDIRVGDKVRWPEALELADPPQVTSPDGTVHPLETASDGFTATDAPGIYSVSAVDGPASFVVHVDPIESDTTPLGPEVFQQAGARLVNAADAPPSEATLQKLRDGELEGRQKIWKWLIAAALAILIVETLVAGWLSRDRPALAPAPA